MEIGTIHLLLITLGWLNAAGMAGKKWNLVVAILRSFRSTLIYTIGLAMMDEHDVQIGECLLYSKALRAYLTLKQASFLCNLQYLV